MPIKFLVLGVGGLGFSLEREVEVPILFLWAWGIFLNQGSSLVFSVFSSDVSKRGWWSEAVVANKTFLCQRLKALFCTSFPICPLRRRGTHYWRLFWAVFGCLFVANPLPPTPLRNL